MSSFNVGDEVVYRDGDNLIVGSVQEPEEECSWCPGRKMVTVLDSKGRYRIDTTLITGRVVPL